jgi:class 3 adenylate cyclase
MAADGINRKLTTILQADIVGYSQLKANDEEAAMAMLRAYRAFVDGQIGKHGGRIFSTAGDAVLAEFASAVEAVRCAIAIQEDLRVRNAELSEDRQMWFRIGINVGDVMIEKDDLFGDGVNVAARLEGLAEKGGICISGSTFDQVKNKLSIAFKDIGPQNVKNIPYPVPAFQLVPGKVAIKVQDVRGQPRAWPMSKAGRAAWLSAAGAAVIAILAGAALFAGVLPYGYASKEPYDGYWKVTVDSLSGCLDNTPRSFPLTVRRNLVDEPRQAFPKKGAVSADGRFNVAVTDKEGNPRATMIGVITEQTGKGGFQGRKPSCKGNVTMVRLQ